MIGKNILLTGAEGYIGSSLVNKLKANNTLLLLSRTSSRKEKNLRYIKTDIRSKKIWRDILQDIEIVYYLAAQTSSQYSNQYPSNDLKTNLMPIAYMIEACQKYGYTPSIVFAGTATETGFTNTKSINGNISDLPITIYDIHKLAAEKYLQYYSIQLKNRAVTLRLSNIYGPGQVSDKKDRGIVNMMIRKAIRGESLSIYGNGEYIRDYIYIDDIVNAFLLAGEKIKVTSGNYYVIGTGEGYSVAAMASIVVDEVKKITGNKVGIIYLPFPKETSQIEYRSFVANNRQFKKDTNWTTKTKLRTGINKTIRYYIENKV